MNSLPEITDVIHEISRTECCVICGENHHLQNCNYIKIGKHIPDNLIPSRAKLTLPNFLEVQILSDGSFSTVTKSVISKGTHFGPFQSERTRTLDPSISFPLKIFLIDPNENSEYYLDVSDEEKCSWLMYIAPAEHLEEQNLICYQEKADIYYAAIKDINIGEALKVWYSPYYAFKMNKPVLTSKHDTDDSLKHVDIDSLIKKQQKIMERKVWTCKFCSQMENDIVSFARHILLHYTAQHKNMCEACKKTFGSKKSLKNHLKIVHRKFFSTPPTKPSKNIESITKSHCTDVALGGPLLNDMFTDSSDLQQSDLHQFDLSIDNQNLLLDNDNLTVENLLNENVKDLDHFNFEIDDSQKQFVCDICLKQFTKVKLLIIHLRYHTGDFTCHKCLKIFCRKENLTSHMCNVNFHHKCMLCEKKFTQRKYLSRHLEAVHNKKFNCVSCGKCYYSNKELLEHNCSKIPIAEKEKYMCPICDKYFYRDIYLKKHLKTHGPRIRTAKPVISVTCEICGLRLESKSSYYFHKKKHEEPSYSCETCNKKFYRQDILREHLLTHQTLMQIDCNICQKKFKSRKILNFHLKRHSEVKSFKCSLCDVTFNGRASLNRHFKNYHEENKSKNITIEYYNCPICYKSIKLKSSVLRHLRKVHSDVSNIDVSHIKPKLFINPCQNNKIREKNKKKNIDGNNRNVRYENVRNNVEVCLQNELDDQINNLLNNAENNSAIHKHAVDSLVKELDIDSSRDQKKTKEACLFLDIDSNKEQKQAREVCLSIPELTENYQEITLDKNAYILDNGTIVQPQGDSDNVIIYVLDQTF